MMIAAGMVEYHPCWGAFIAAMGGLVLIVDRLAVPKEDDFEAEQERTVNWCERK